MVAFGGAGRRAGGVSAGRDRETLTSEVTMKFCLDSDNCCAFIHKTPKSGIREDRPPLVR